MLKQKVSRANGLLAKVRYYLSPKFLRTLYSSIFESHLRYGSQIWGQYSNQYLKYTATQNILNYQFQKEIQTCGATFQRNKNYGTKWNNKVRKLCFGLAWYKPMPSIKSKSLLTSTTTVLETQPITSFLCLK